MKTKYELRVTELENEGLSTSDAQGVADVEFAQAAALPMLEALDALNAKLTELNADGKLDDLNLDSLIKQAFEATGKARGES